MRSTAAERKLLHRMLLLGLALTACAVVLQALGFLNPLEGYLFDQRVKRCQYTAPNPSDRIVHFDIDDASIEAVARWPWPRNVMADMLNEFHRAGAKVIALDILYSERENTGDEAPTPNVDNQGRLPTTRAIHPHDAALAASLAVCRCGVLPVNFTFDRPRASATHLKEVENEIHGNLEITLEEVNQRLESLHAAPATEDEFKAVMHEVSSRKLSDAFDDGKAPFDVVARTLLPNITARLVGGGSIQARRLEKEYDKFTSWSAARQFFPYIREGSPPLLQPADEQLPIPEFGEQMVACGFVNESEAVVRAVPLFADFRSQLVPQFGLAIALRYLGTRLEDVTIGPDHITIPVSDEKGKHDIIIPTYAKEDSGNESGGTFIDVPLIGTANWQTMYDPRHVEIRQHYQALFVTNISETRHRIRRNNETLDQTLVALLPRVDSALLKAYQAKKHDLNKPDALATDAAAVLGDPIMQDVLKMTPKEVAELDEDNRVIFRLAATTQELTRQNASFGKVLTDEEAELRRRVGGKIVMVGSSAAGVELRTTSLHARCPGVVVHGAIVNAVLTGYFWRRLPLWMTYLSIIAVGGASTITASYLRPTGAFVFTMAIGVGFGFFSSVIVFGHWRSLLGMAGPLTAVFLVWSVIPIARFLTESALRWRIQRRFSTYVDPALVNYLTEHPEKMRLAGELKEITVVFTDLQGFTALTEKMRERAVDILSEYMALVIPLIRARNGFVSKFIGDGVMFFYGAPLENPNQAIDAVDTAMAMIAAVDGFSTSLIRRGLDRLGLRIGINTATMVVGDTGIETAADYTPLGDGMNLGSRLEGANKMFGTHVLVSARTVYQLDGRYLVRKIANLIVKGKTEAVMAYEPICKADEATDEQKQLAEMSDAMVDAYIAGEFETCIELSRKVEMTFGKDRVAICYRERSEACLETPPQFFNGTIQLSEK